jgi:hypothetical protein
MSGDAKQRKREAERKRYQNDPEYAARKRDKNRERRRGYSAAIVALKQLGIQI